VSDFALTASTGLDGALTPGLDGAPNGTPGITITPRTGLALANVIVRAGKTDDLTQRVQETYGLSLPATPQRVEANTIGFAWAGPGQWLAMTESTDGHAFVQMLRRELDGLASVIDQSDGRAILRIGGRKARETFAKSIPLDLDPSVFHAGDVALTVAGHINVHLWQIDDTPTYEVAVFRSFVVAFCEALKQAAAEFGVAVTAPA
jgi:heterotetrameric sarcosine oxidase gamma subunit